MQDDFLEFAQVEVDPFHFSSQMLEQLRIDRLVEVVQIRDWLLHPKAEELLPNAVGDRCCKTRVVRMGEPHGKLVAPLRGSAQTCAGVGGAFLISLAPRNQPGMDFPPGLGVLVFVVLGEGQFVCRKGVNLREVWAKDSLCDFFIQIEALGGLSCVLFGEALFGGAEEGGHFKKVALGPAGYGMIVALRAGDVGPQKGRERVGKIVQRHAPVPEQVPDGAGAGEPTLGRHQVIDERVPVAVGGNLFLEPFLIDVGFDALAVVVLEAEHVAQPVKPL